jgi:cytidylate kinase
MAPHIVADRQAQSEPAPLAEGIPADLSPQGTVKVASAARGLADLRSSSLVVDIPIPRPDVLRLDGPVIITIDGPAGTGKSSVARLLARRLGLDFLDTGAMYRAAAAVSLDRGVPHTDTDAFLALVKDADLHFDWTQDPPAILAWQTPLGDRIREGDVTAIVSPVAGIAALRTHMVAKQRLIARQHPRLVSEGRDQGSIVFPDASAKFYLDARADVRARRRAHQLRAQGDAHVDEHAILQDIIARDQGDMSRADGPLIRPDGATLVDTSDLTRDQVVDALERFVREAAAPSA